MNTEVVSEPFRTEELSDAVTFEVEFTNRYYDGADFTVTPSDDEFPYYCTIRPAFQYDELSDQELLYEVIHGGDPADCCQRLLDITISRGAPDNVTAVLFQIL